MKVWIIFRDWCGCGAWSDGGRVARECVGKNCAMDDDRDCGMDRKPHIRGTGLAELGKHPKSVGGLTAGENEINRASITRLCFMN